MTTPTYAASLTLIYRLGLNIRQASYAVKKYKSHRRVNRAVLMDIEVLKNGTNG